MEMADGSPPGYGLKTGRSLPASPALWATGSRGGVSRCASRLVEYRQPSATWRPAVWSPADGGAGLQLRHLLTL